MALTTAAVLGIIATGAMAAGQIQQGRAEQKQLDFQASVSRQQAASEKVISAQQERGYRKAQAANLGEIRAALGGSGTVQNTGTPLLALSDFGTETELNALRIRSGGEIRSRRLEEQAGFQTSAGSSVLQRGYVRAGSSLLSALAGSFK